MKVRLLVLFVFITSITLAVSAVLWGWSALHANKAYHYIDEWEKSGQIGSISDWESAFQSMRHARKFNPYSVDYMIAMGQLYEWSTRLMVFRADKEKTLSEAKKYYQLATTHRPTWPHAWAHYLFVTALLGDNGETLNFAISKVEKYGPWVIEPQQKMIIASLSKWESLPLVVQLNIEKSIQKWLMINSDKTLKKKYLFHRNKMRRFIISNAVNMEKGYVVSNILAKMKNVEENMLLLKRLKAQKAHYCNQEMCLHYPVERFKERFEV